MNLDTDQPEPGAPIAMPGEVSRLAVDPPIVAAATSDGAVLVSATDPTMRVVLGVGPVTDVALARFTAYVVQADQVRVFDITKPEQPREVRPIRLDAAGTAVAAARNQLLVADEVSALRLYTLENPRNPRRRDALGSSYHVTQIVPVGDYAYLGSESGLHAASIAVEPREFNLGWPQTHPVFGLDAGGS
jgi:hypothetical protein